SFDAVDGYRHVVDAGLVPHDPARKNGRSVIGDQLDIDVLRVEFGNPQSHFGQITPLRRNAEQSRETLDGGVEIGDDDADVIDARQRHPTSSRSFLVASRSASRVAESIATP